MELAGLRVESFQCRNHPDREGVGICVACRRVFCVECSTKIDGVNHCRECLARKQRTAQATTARRSGLFARFLELVFSATAIGASLCVAFGLLVFVGDASAKGGARHVPNRDRMEAVARALRSYRRDVGTFPGDDEGLKALVKRPPKAAGWQGPYIDLGTADTKGEALDAYEMPIRYRAPRAGETACVIGSGGGDRIFQTDMATVERNKLAPGGDGAAEGDDLVLFVD